MAEKVYRIVEEDIDEDGNADITLKQGDAPIITVYDWRSVLLQWVSTTSALVVAGFAVIQLW